MAVRSKRLLGPVRLPTGAAVAYTCPLGETTLIKHIEVYNNAVLGVQWNLALNGSGGVNQMAGQVIASGNTLRLITQFVVLQPGDTLWSWASADGLNLSLFGAQLEGVAD